MDERIRTALATDRIIDITTTGRKSGEPRRIEIWFHYVDEKVYITGTPGRPRSWLANMQAHPQITFHLKGTVQADLPATAVPIRDPDQRRQILTKILDKIGASLDGSPPDVDSWVAESPLVEIKLDA